MKPKLCIVTGSRAEYSSYLPILKSIINDGSFCLHLIVTGMHLSEEYGFTYKEIENDGFPIDEKLELLNYDDSAVGVSKSLGLGIMKIAESLNKIQPNFMLLIGDRYETFAAAIAAHVANIPIAHVGGGDLSLGAMDDAFRHSITKMSQLHFTSTEKHRARLIQLGEQPSRVFVSGAPGIDNIMSLPLLTKNQLQTEISFPLINKYAVITYHPATLDGDSSGDQFKELLCAISLFNDLNYIFTLPNADTGGKSIINLINEYVSLNPAKATAYSSLGQIKYLSLLKYSEVVIGNSSSGIVEAPLFGKPTVNIGNRQSGRDKAASIIDCLAHRDDIYLAICKSLSPEFIQSCSTSSGIYGSGNAASIIINTIKNHISALTKTHKVFYDMPNLQHTL